MGLDVDIIFKIAGVGIVVAFLHYHFGSSRKKRICAVGNPLWFYLYFVYGGHYRRKFISKN